MNYADFVKLVKTSREDIYLRTFEENRERILVKKEATVVRNMEKIFDATLRISNRKGFQAMTMRDLSGETGLSMGALYSYFPSKEKLLEILQKQHRQVARRIFETCVGDIEGAQAKLRAAIRAHLFLSEIMQPWFYFSFMETKNLVQPERDRTIAGDNYTDGMFAEILRQGQEEGAFVRHDQQLAACVIKAVLQDWYLKRKKYAKQNINVDDYARFVLEFLEGYLGRRET